MTGRWPLELDVTSGPVRRAAMLLLRDQRVRFAPRALGSRELPPQGPVLRLQPGSRAYGAVTLLWGPDEPRDDTESQAEIGLSRAAWWHGVGQESWRDLGLPLSLRPHVGSLDFARPWVLLGPGAAATSATELEAKTGLRQAQLHLLDPRGLRAKNAVWWPSTRRTLRALLGHVDAVVAAPGPLSWDAARVGVPTWLPDRFSAAEASPELASRRLARLVPESLLGDLGFWRDIVSDLLRGDFSNWGTRQWLLRARERSAARERAWPARARRALARLRRDPSTLWAEARQRLSQRA